MNANGRRLYGSPDSNAVMDNDQFALVERVLKDFDNVLSKEPNLASFELVCAEREGVNRSPVLVRGRALALESWCARHVYVECWRRVCERGTGGGRALDVAVLLNPEVRTLWSRRRALVHRGRLSPRSELRLAALALSRLPKCNEAFSYRRWLWDYCIDEWAQSSERLGELVREELEVSALAAERSANNYHAWSHRAWLLEKLAPHRALLPALHCLEFAFSEHWSATHVSDHSSHRYRQLCVRNAIGLSEPNWTEFTEYTRTDIGLNLAKMVNELVPESPASAETARELLGPRRCACPVSAPAALCRALRILFYELNLNTELISYFAHHETLWYHRRFVVHEILSAARDYHAYCALCSPSLASRPSAHDHRRYDTNALQSSLVFLLLLNCDRKLTAEGKARGDRYSDRHIQYLKLIEGVSL